MAFDKVAQERRDDELANRTEMHLCRRTEMNLCRRTEKHLCRRTEMHLCRNYANTLSSGVLCLNEAERSGKNPPS